MAIKPLPDRALVRQLLHYDRSTGVFTWRTGQRAGLIAGRTDGNGYRSIYISRGFFLAHRIVWLYVRGEPVPPLIDHRNRIKLDNRIGNLRAGTKSQNGANAKLYSANKTGVKGVFRYARGTYRAKVTHDGVEYHLGSFATLQEAAKARREAAKKLHGSFYNR